MRAFLLGAAFALTIMGCIAGAVLWRFARVIEGLEP